MDRILTGMIVGAIMTLLIIIFKYLKRTWFEYQRKSKITDTYKPHSGNNNGNSGIVLKSLIVIGIIVWVIYAYSDSKISEKEPDSTEVPSSYENVSTNSDMNNSTNSEYSEPVKNKKFCFIEVRILKPVVYQGIVSEYSNIPAKVEKVESKIFSEIVEIEDYNEDVKYRLIDKFDKTLNESINIIELNFNAELTSTNNYNLIQTYEALPMHVDIISKEVNVFDSYSEAYKRREAKE